MTTTTERELQHFVLLDHAEQEAAILRLAATGMPESSIAEATRLHVEVIRKILARQTSP